MQIKIHLHAILLIAFCNINYAVCFDIFEFIFGPKLQSNTKSAAAHKDFLNAVSIKISSFAIKFQTSIK